ncbi:MAG TPA: glutathione S-transferase family protein [Methylophaga aminisulfidivorans]|uniref:Glutathione S-transferase family protein n=1 Tax=Methylophaga aminisulfidivorans TaxID=230105 RepID=A0A7C1ZH34_9GAMM|nr:glutathione S-transferase family protein [Methylophaga aminisulfidivorans]
MILYNIALSGNCHKVRLMLAFLGLDYQLYDLDLGSSEQLSDDYLKLNTFGQAPVLDDDGIIIRDSQAILVYLAKKYADRGFWPDDPADLAQVISWLSTAANEIQNGPTRIRAHYKFGRAIDFKQVTETTDKVLKIIDMHLTGKVWLVGDQMSIADIAMYPYLALAHEGHVDITPYLNITAWLTRFESLPNYVSMPGITQTS